MTRPRRMTYHTRILAACPRCGTINDFRAACLRNRAASTICAHFVGLEMRGRHPFRVVFEGEK